MKSHPCLALLLGTLVTVALSPPSAYAADSPSQTLNGVLIQAVDRAGIYSGFVAAWDRWTVETQAGATIHLFSRAFGPQDPLPYTGQRCDLRYHMAQYDEGVGPGLKTNVPFAAVDDSTCMPVAQQPTPPNP